MVTGENSDVCEQSGAISHCPDQSQSCKLHMACAKCLCGVTLLGELVLIPVMLEDVSKLFT